MEIILRALHVTSGELGFLFILWTIIEVAWGSLRTGVGVVRAKIASLVGFVLVWVTWLAGGSYYVVYYGSAVKPIIKAGPWPWAHAICMEAKEHVFLFLPFLVILLFVLVWKYGARLPEEKELRLAFFSVSGVTILVFISMIITGFLVSAGYRIAVP